MKTSRSWAGVLRYLGLKVGGGTQFYMRKLAVKLNLDVSHMTGQGWNLDGVGSPEGKPLSEILVESSTYSNTNRLKKRLIREGIKEHRCEVCKLTEWMGSPIPIRLDHINGHRDDYRLENLRIICPNCDAQTETYCGKNVGRYASMAKLVNAAVSKTVS